jgi:hypothetical protein
MPRYRSVFAVLAILAFAVALIFNLAGGSVAQYVLDATLTGLICLAIHLAVNSDWPWTRQGPAGVITERNV